MKGKPIVLLSLLLVVVTCGAALAVFLVRQTHNSPASGTHVGTSAIPLANVSAPHGEGTQIVDASGRPLVLRGAEYDSSLTYISGWEKGKRPAKYPGAYTGQLDQVVQAANSAGLYVVLALHDDVHAGSPYPKGNNLPKVEDVTFWKAIAAHYRENPKIMFDLFNEPKDPDWSTWLRGGKSINGAKTVGFLDLIAAVRSSGAPQVVFVEPGSAGKGGANGGNAAQWGPILHRHPIYYGEWALQPNASGQDGLSHCMNIPHSAADQIVNAFLNLYGVAAGELDGLAICPSLPRTELQELSSTSLDVSWTCGDTHLIAGMGTLIRNYLTGQS